MLYIALFTCLIISTIATPLVKKLAIKIGAVDQPDERKVHVKLMPRLGGLAIFVSFLIGFLLFFPGEEKAWPIILGALIIVITGVIDDMKGVSPKVKMLGQLLAAIAVVAGGIQIEYVTLPFSGRIEFEFLAIPITIIWILAITNAINLIDGLDGLAAGVSSIALITISGLAITMGNDVTALIGMMLLGSTVGFLFYNFHPAKIFMGDTGSLFLGYMISVISIMGLYKNVTLFSLIVPIIILAVPIIDTLFAIIRRVVNKKPLSAPDKYHLHHRLLRLGFSHKQSVLLIYFLSAIFSLAALMYTESTLWGSTIIILTLLVLIELLVEVTGLISENYRPILKLLENKKAKM